MKKICLSLFIFCLAGCLTAQEKYQPRSRTIVHKVGDDNIKIEITEYGDKKDIVFINLHADETTSVESAKKILETRGGFLIRFDNDEKRNIHFRIKDQSYTVDPNRIFSRQGIERTLARSKNSSPEAIAEVEKLASRLLSLIPNENTCVIALHNNTEGRLSIQSYMPGNEFAADAQEVFANHSKDPDDFFLTTDSLLFQQLSALEYNMVLQDNARVQQDGSLSVYFGEKNLCYLNCETEHGKLAIYNEMLLAALQMIEEKSMKN